VAGAGPESYRLERRVAAFVAEREVLKPAEHVLLMLSGGADSMALLAMLPFIDGRLRFGLRASALHVDYAMRGADSDRDRELVERACASAGVPLVVVRLRRSAAGPSFQARARDLRYGHARETAALLECDAVVTAHNRDDQAETVLYRLTKYASPRGLAGMRPREGRLARPLLCLGAAEIRKYCHARGLEYGEDVSNALPVYSRNALRLQVLPALEALNPRVAETLADTAAMSAAEQDVLAEVVASALARVASSPQVGDLAALRLAALAAEPPALRALVVHDAVRGALGGRALVPRRVVEAVLKLCVRRDGGGRVALTGGLEVVRDGGALRIRRRAVGTGCEAAAIAGADLVAAGAAGVALGVAGRAFRAWLVRGPHLDAVPGTACVGLAAPPARLALRRPGRGERFEPLGLGHGTTVARFLAGAGVPAPARSAALVLEVDGASAWVGFTARDGRWTGRVAQGFRVHESSRCTVHVVQEGP